ncbi:hypothetical protein ACH4VR_36320 [Streptomyces sp. NPDC020883]|uniref:hypothetical protein n=1 Tax=Streptomyces sp. NPDC020883 TaxID=3365099 RepID=UPI0037ABE0CB
MPTIAVLNRVRRDIDAGQLNGTAAALTGYGLAELVTMPNLREWQAPWDMSEQLANPAPRAATIAFSLARTVTDHMSQQARGGPQ